MAWTPDHLASQDGRTFVITGANSGIGFHAARLLARAGGRVLLACRDETRARQAAETIATDTGRTPEVVQLDLASLDSIARGTGAVRERVDRIDVLINNAGVMALPRRTTTDGFEMQLGVNHLGHFAWTAHLWDALASDGRVVTVSSLAHKRGAIDWADLDGERRYGKWRAYAQSKLANLVFALELDRRLRAAGSDIRSIACHPGFAATELQRRGPEMQGRRLLARTTEALTKVVSQSAEQGAWPTVCAATAEIDGGAYLGPTRLAETRGPVGDAYVAGRARDPETGARLWQVSEERTGVRFEVTPAALRSGSSQ